MLDNIAAQDVNILKVFGNGTVSPDIDSLIVYILLFSGKLITQLSEHVKLLLIACRYF